MGEELVEDVIDEAVIVSSSVPENVGEATKEVVSEVVNQTKSIFHLDEIQNYLTWGNMVKVITAIIAVLALWGVYKLLTRFVKKAASKKLEQSTVKVLTETIRYAFYILVTMYVLNLLGIDLTGILGAAGVAGVAIGFAAQTAFSNIISGGFVKLEHFCKPGDFIEVCGVSGTVTVVGLSSVTIHTLDNQVVRIPNTSMVNSNLTNYTKEDNRRYVFPLPISYDSDMDVALEAAKEIADICIEKGIVLADPAPAAFYDGFNDAVDLRLAVWFKKTDLVATKNAVYTTAAKVFKQRGVVIPFTHYDISIVSDDSNKKSAPKQMSKPLEKKISSPAKVEKKIDLAKTDIEKVVKKPGRRPKKAEEK